MSFPSNTSPYGSNQVGNFQPNFAGASQDTGQSGGLWQSLFGRPERNYQQSTLGREQQPGYQNLLQAGQTRGAGGAFGQSADYYRDLLDPNSQTASAMMDPEMRRFNQDIMPQLAEQFSGYGGIGSSGFRNTATSASVDLSERLANIRAQLRQQGAKGLSDIGQMGLQSYNESIHRPETFGLMGGIGEGLGKGIGTYLGTKMPGRGE